MFAFIFVQGINSTIKRTDDLQMPAFGLYQCMTKRMQGISVFDAAVIRRIMNKNRSVAHVECSSGNILIRPKSVQNSSIWTCLHLNY